jgi:hypothetical protein
MPLFNVTHCSLKTLLDAARSLDAWFSLDFSHTAIIHCVNGDCSALVAACWLIYAGLFEDGTEALDYVLGRRRAALKKAGSTVDLFRYAEYFASLVSANGSVPNSKALRLRQIVLKGNLAGKGKFSTGHLGIELYERGQLIFKNSGPVSPHRTSNGNDSRSSSTILFDFPLLNERAFRKEILLKIQTCDATGHPREPLFHFNFHTGFIPDGIVRMIKKDLHWYSGTLQVGSNFCMELDLEADTSVREEDTSYEPFLDRSLLKCLARLVVNHTIKANEILLTALIGMGHGRIIGMNVVLL